MKHVAEQLRERSYWKEERIMAAVFIKQRLKIEKYTTISGYDNKNALQYYFQSSLKVFCIYAT